MSGLPVPTALLIALLFLLFSAGLFALLYVLIRPRLRLERRLSEEEKKGRRLELVRCG